MQVQNREKIHGKTGTFHRRPTVATRYGRISLEPFPLSRNQLYIRRRYLIPSIVSSAMFLSSLVNYIIIYINIYTPVIQFILFIRNVGTTLKTDSYQYHRSLDF